MRREGRWPGPALPAALGKHTPAQTWLAQPHGVLCSRGQEDSMVVTGSHSGILNPAYWWFSLSLAACTCMCRQVAMSSARLGALYHLSRNLKQQLPPPSHVLSAADEWSPSSVQWSLAPASLPGAGRVQAARWHPPPQDNRPEEDSFFPSCSHAAGQAGTQGQLRHSHRRGQRK